MAHNTNVTDVEMPYGGLPKFVAEGLNEDYLPLWMQDAGYETYYIGKIMNQVSVGVYQEDWPKGWTGADLLIDPYTYQYYNAGFAYNAGPLRNYAGKYSTDVIANESSSWLGDIIERQQQARQDGDDATPFFFVAAPIGPHSTMTFPEDVPFIEAPQYAERHASLFADVQIPRTSNFNPEKVSGAAWIRDQQILNDTQVQVLDEFYRSRLRALQAVDELVERLVLQLENAGLLDNTYIFYSSDNGYHLGHHRCPAGKSLAYEEDINVPLIVRGPGIERGSKSRRVSGHVDLAPTFLKLAGACPRDIFDGKPINLTPEETVAQDSGADEHVQVEFWGNAGFEMPGGAIGAQAGNTYKALRLLSTDYSLFYSSWCSGEHELYDMKADPDQMYNLLLPDEALQVAQNGTKSKNLHTDGDNVLLFGRTPEDVAQRLDGLLFVLKDCQADTCRRPWQNLHESTGGDVSSILDALSPEYDSFYSQLPKVTFETCASGYIRSNEGESWAGYLESADRLIQDTPT